MTSHAPFELGVTASFQQAFARPEPRLAEGRLFVDRGVKTGMDISDGLLSDLGHICRASGVGAVVETRKIPIREDVKATFGPHALDMALSGGEDYQLLITARPPVIDAVIKDSVYPVTVIGKIVADNPGRVIVINQEGERLQPGSTGWDHFKSKR
jgi:thiamine-monophosphate kinase